MYLCGLYSLLSKGPPIFVWPNPSPLRNGHCRPPHGDQRLKVRSRGPASEKEVINDPNQMLVPQAGADGFWGRSPLLSPHTPQGLRLARQESAHRNSLSLPADLLAPLWSLLPLAVGSTPQPATSSLGVLPRVDPWGCLSSTPQAGFVSAGPSLGQCLATQFSLGRWRAWGAWGVW